MKILGIDPGLTATGYGIISQDRTFVTGTIRPHAKESAAKIIEICAAIEQVVREHDPSLAALEKAFYNKNARSLMLISELRGALRYLLHRLDVPCVEYAPTQVKLTTTGNGNASKAQVRFWLERLLAVPDRRQRRMISHHAVDALSIAYTAQRKVKPQ